jgi:hypothetical protein
MKQALTAVAFITVISTIGFAQSRAAVQLPLRLSGVVVSAGGVGNPTGTARVDIAVNRLSTTEERAKLADVLTHKGQDALLDALREAKSVGTIRFNTELAWDLRYARQLPRDEGGTRIYLATDRPMSMAELWNQPRYSQYPFTLIELQFDGDGRASGSLMLAARVTADKDGRFIEVENFASEAIPITQIEMQR